MTQLLSEEMIISAADHGTGSDKFLALNTRGQSLASASLPANVHVGVGGSRMMSVSEVRERAFQGVSWLADTVRCLGLCQRWAAHGISATHHTAGRFAVGGGGVRDFIMWHDETLPEFHARGLARLGGQDNVRALIGAPWAPRYSLTHLVKDEETLPQPAWEATHRMLPHGAAVAAMLTGNWDACGVSPAGSTGIFDLRTRKWCLEMLGAIGAQHLRELAAAQLPKIVDHFAPVGRLRIETGNEATRPYVFPTIDDQAAALIGGGAISVTEAAAMYGNSCVVSTPVSHIPNAQGIDVMPLPSGNFALRCSPNCAAVSDAISGITSEASTGQWDELLDAVAQVPAGCRDLGVLPFAAPETALGIRELGIRWYSVATGNRATPPDSPAVACRAVFEAIGYLTRLAIEDLATAGAEIRKVTLSGGMTRSKLFTTIIASIIPGYAIRLLKSDEGSALGAGVVALHQLENKLRRDVGIAEPFTLCDAAARMVHFAKPPQPCMEWVSKYEAGYRSFLHQIATLRHGT